MPPVRDGKVEVMDQSTQTSVFPLLDLPSVVSEAGYQFKVFFVNVILSLKCTHYVNCVFFLQVIDDILSYLPPKSCLTLRLVCKATLEWVSTLPPSPQEIEKWKRYQLSITGKEFRTFSSAVTLSLPISSFRIQNKILANKAKIYESKGVQEFIHLYKNRKVSFTVDTLCMLQLPEEQTFFFSFQNLYELKIIKLRSYLRLTLQQLCDDEGLNYVDKFRQSFLRPPNTLVSSLRRLVIKDCESPSMPLQVTDQLILDFILSFKNLDYLSPPSKITKFTPAGFPWIFRSRKSTYCPTWMDSLGKAIIQNDWKNVPEVNENKQKNRNQKTNNFQALATPPLERNRRLHLDLRAFTKTRYTTRAYLTYVEYYVRLLQESYQRNMLLYNVYSPLLESMYDHWLEHGWTQNMIQQSFKFLENIVSLSVAGNVLQFGFCEMKRLEEITIFHDLGEHQWIYHDSQKLSWPHLKTLKLSMHIREKDLHGVSTEVWDLMFRRLFKNPKRSSVTSLTLKMSSDFRAKSWDADGGGGDSKMMDFHEEMFSVPTITRNFANLKCLTILGWLASNDSFHELFSGLPRLEYVSIGACRLLSDFGLKNISGKH